MLTSLTNLDGECMNIVFEDKIDELKKRYTVLELDTFWVPELKQHRTAYCVLETMPVDELNQKDAYVKVHADLIQFYKQQYWTYCEHAIEGLRGKWAGVLDSFYDDLLTRVKQYQETPPPPDWNGARVKTANDATVSHTDRVS